MALRDLQARIVACRRCPRLVRFREAVAAAPPRRFRGETYWARPVPSLGDASARLLLVGLAPAAHGGNRTGRMFTGDAAGGSGEWVARALHGHGFATQSTSRDRGDGFALVEAYITAALHCVPPDNRPTTAELRRCAGYLHEELPRLRRVRVVLGLGRIGFDAYLAAAGAIGLPVPRPRPKFGHGAAIELPWGVTLLATYHPSRQNTQTGRLTWPMFEAMFAEARRRLGPSTSPARPTAPS
jgi:uracil-DNA glycosylase family 4